MPEPLSTTTVLILFYLVFLGQIFLISIYYPGKLRRRIEYVLTHFPPDRYPKLYPRAKDGFAGEEGKRRLRLFRWLNYAIAGVGIMTLSTMAVSGYRPDLKGGDEVFVLIYFFLQMCPFLYAAIRESGQYRLMRRAFSESTRRAALQPRRLFNFVSPVQVFGAVLLYVAFVAYYLFDKGLGAPFEGEVYLTVGVVTGMNLLFAGMIVRHLLGRKLNPYQAPEDQLNVIESVTKVLVFTSILVSVFLIATIAVDRYALEVLDPPLTSVYLQLCVAFGIGMTFRRLRVEAIDFEVYREGGPGRPVLP